MELEVCVKRSCLREQGDASVSLDLEAVSQLQPSDLTHRRSSKEGKDATVADITSSAYFVSREETRETN